MNTKTIAIVSATATVVTGLWAYINIIGSEAAIMELYPEIPPKIIVKAHRRLLRDVLTGNNPIPTDSDAAIEDIFIRDYVTPLMK